MKINPLDVMEYGEVVILKDTRLPKYKRLHNYRICIWLERPIVKCITSCDTIALDINDEECDSWSGCNKNSSYEMLNDV